MVNLDQLGSTALAGDDSYGRTPNIKPVGDRGDQREVGGTVGGRGRDPGFERLAVPTKPGAAGAWMRPNRQT